MTVKELIGQLDKLMRDTGLGDKATIYATNPRSDYAGMVCGLDVEEDGRGNKAVVLDIDHDRIWFSG